MTLKPHSTSATNKIDTVSSRVSLLSAAIAGCIFSAPSIAQSSESPSIGLEEIVVTARRREERLQDVPITINAFNDEYLRDHAVDSFSDIQNHTPTMNITFNSADTIEPKVSLRGVVPNEARLNDDPSAPMYFSDVVMTPSTGINLSLYDIGMVQVLKGPQGTLFGRNSTAGAILINPKLPGDEFGGFVDLTAGNYGMYRTDFGVDAPVSDTLQLRFAGRKLERDGYQTNKNDLPQDIADYGKELWDDNTSALRMSARWQPTDNIENITVVDWSEKHSLARAAKAVVTGRPQFQASVNRNLALTDPYDVRVNIIAPENVENGFLSNTTTVDIGDLTFKNILGYRKTESFRMIDLDGMDAAVVQSREDGSGDSTDAEQYSNEFQVLGSALDAKLDWVVGAYYYFMDGTAIQNTASGGGQFETGTQESTSYAVFAQGTYNFDSPWSLTVGVRQSWDQREVEINRYTGVIANPPIGLCGLRNPDPGCSVSDSGDFDSPTWNTSLAYDFSDDVMAYVTVGSGFKAGGYNLRANSSAELQPYDEETVISYEAGVKADWSIGTWQVRSSASLYRMDFQDIQVTVGECLDLGGPVCTVVTVKKNAAEATYQGAELQLSVLPTDNLEFNLGYGFVDPEYTEWLDKDSQGNIVDRSDRKFAFQPENELNASVRYTLPLDEKVGTVSLMASLLWRDESYLAVDPSVLADPRYSDLLIQDAYQVIDLRLDWRSVYGSNIDLSAYVENLDEELYLVSANEQLRDNRNLFLAEIYGEPRTFGVSLRYTF